MANIKRKSAAKPAAKKKTIAAKPAKKQVKASVRKPAPKQATRAKSAAKPSARKPVKTAKASKPAKKHVAPKPAPKKTLAPGKSRAPVKAAKPVPSKTIAKAKKEKMAVVTVKDTITREDGHFALSSTTVVELPRGYRPTVREEYMGLRQLAYFRRKLQQWRDDLVEESKQTIDNLREEVRDVGDEAERATRETENSLELRTRDRYRKLIAKIDKALKRIEDGRYGFCEETDEEIGIERLEARPIATLCLDAQERWEHRQKQMGD